MPLKLFVASAPVLSLSAAVRCADLKDAAAKDVSLDGTWLPSAAEIAGQKFPDEIRKTIRRVPAVDPWRSASLLRV